jgi:uncharacterized protein (TIRG00374 family)
VAQRILPRHASKKSIRRRLVKSRDFVRDALTESWARAVPAAFGNQAFDFLSLWASRLAVGAHIQPASVPVGVRRPSTLAMVPITPGGTGFVETGLSGVLLLAAVSFDNTVLATFFSRLFSYRLPMPVGAGAAAAFKHRHKRLT